MKLPPNKSFLKEKLWKYVVKSNTSDHNTKPKDKGIKVPTPFQVKWCMDVICFGLSLPLQEHETIKDCVNVYCEWLTALHPQPRISVPKPICEDANLYARQIINHFHNLFVPRQGESEYT